MDLVNKMKQLEEEIKELKRLQELHLTLNPVLKAYIKAVEKR